jgi:amino acid permease
MSLYLLGAGILTLGSAFGDIGSLGGVICLMLFGMVSFASCMALYFLHHMTGKVLYSDMVENLFGRKGKYYVDAIQVSFFHFLMPNNSD